MVVGVLGDFQQAIKCHEKALSIDPEFKEAIFSKGMALGGFGKVGDALECFDNALRIDPEYKAALNKKQELLNLLSK